VNHIKKPLIIVLWPYGFRPFDWDRLELDELSMHANVEVHEVIQILSPHFVKAYSILMDDKHLFRFQKIANWRARFDQLLNENNECDVYILNFVSIVGWLSLFINIYIHLSGVAIIEYRQPGIPVNHHEGLMTRVSAMVKSLYCDYSSLKILVIFLKKIYVRCLTYFALMFIDSSRNFLFFVGKNQHAQQSRKRKKEALYRVIPANSWDYSRILRLSSVKCESLVKSRYAVLLDGAGPKFYGDELLTGDKLNFTAESWYPMLCKLFDRLEVKFNLRIVIAAHPKTSHERFPSYFGGREVFHGDTYRLVKNADFVLTRQSTAISYALYFRKPILFLTSNELELIPAFKISSSKIAGELGKTQINVDCFDDKAIMDSIKFDLDLYKEFILSHLSSDYLGRPNYEILLNDVMGIKINPYLGVSY
jgi:hypothetical protein